jgi:hypothetical protein
MVLPISIGIFILKLVFATTMGKMSTERTIEETKKSLKEILDAAEESSKKTNKKLRLSETIFMGLITVTGDKPDTEIEDMWERVKDKYEIGVIFEDIRLSNDNKINDDIQFKILKISESKRFNSVFGENEKIITTKYRGNLPVVYYLDGNTMTYLKKSDITESKIQTFIEKLVIQKTDEIVGGGKYKNKSKTYNINNRMKNSINFAIRNAINNNRASIAFSGKQTRGKSIKNIVRGKSGKNTARTTKKKR